MATHFRHSGRFKGSVSASISDFSSPLGKDLLITFWIRGGHGNVSKLVVLKELRTPNHQLRIWVVRGNTCLRGSSRRCLHTHLFLFVHRVVVKSVEDGEYGEGRGRGKEATDGNA